MMPCCYIKVYRADGPHGLCGASGEYQDVAGSWCGLHWKTTAAPLWYANGMAYGWDKSRPDPTVDL